MLLHLDDAVVAWVLHVASCEGRHAFCGCPHCRTPEPGPLDQWWLRHSIWDECESTFPLTLLLVPRLFVVLGGPNVAIGQVYNSSCDGHPLHVLDLGIFWRG